MKNGVALYSLSFSELRTYAVAAIFVAGNILLPQVAHLIPQGGFIFLPIYFFTLIGAYKYGIKVGLLTAILSPLVNNLLFGMPPMEVLPEIMMKSVVLASSAAFVASSFKKVTIPLLFAVVMTYQIVGSLIEWAMVGDLFTAVQDFRIGAPGMLIQIFGGYFLFKYLLKK